MGSPELTPLRFAAGEASMTALPKRRGGRSSKSPRLRRAAAQHLRRRRALSARGKFAMIGSVDRLKLPEYK